MQTITREEKIADSVPDAMAWLNAEYPQGIDLVFVDYRDQYEDMDRLQKLLKTGESEHDYEWTSDAQHESITEIIKNYTKEIDCYDVSDEVKDAMREWTLDHDTSDPQKELLAHTGSKLFFIGTRDYAEQDAERNTGTDPKDYRRLVKKYGKTPEQKKAVEHVLDEQFYGAPVSFYFYADVEDVYNAIHKAQSKYIAVRGAYFSTIDRVQGSNWIGEAGLFNLAIPRADFISDVYLDDAKGNGYGWGSIAGQTGYDEASIVVGDALLKDEMLLQSETSEAQKREARLQENWDTTKKCTAGDMNWSRHVGPQNYRNDYPCGNKCAACGTFWID